MAKRTFENSPLSEDILDIIRAEKQAVVVDYKGTLHTAKEDLEIWDLESYELVRDYFTQVADSGKVRFKIGLGDYQARIFPNRGNLEFTLRKTLLNQEGSQKQRNSATEIVRYKAIFNPKDNPVTTAGDVDSIDPVSLNTTGMATVTLELLDRAMEPLRIVTVNGVYRQVTPEKLIRNLLGATSQKVRVDGKPAIAGIDFIPPDNGELMPSVVIPDGVHLTALPTYIHEKICGVYSRGIGTYLQTYNNQRTWFVYPLYDPERMDKPGKRVVFYLAPQDRYPELDRSYEVKGDLLRVVITGGRTIQEKTDLDQMNEGAGYRMPDARAFMGKPVELTPKGPKGNRTRLMHEVVIAKREDGLNYAPMVRGGPSSNPYTEQSRVSQQALGQFDVVWENANPDLLFPGMPCKCLYLSQGEVVTIKGTVAFVHALSMRVEKGNSSGYRTTCRISLSVKPDTRKPEVPAQTTVGDNP